MSPRLTAASRGRSPSSPWPCSRRSPPPPNPARPGRRRSRSRTGSRRSTAPTRAPPPRVRALGRKEDTVRVIVGLQTRFTPEGALDDAARQGPARPDRRRTRAARRRAGRHEASGRQHVRDDPVGRARASPEALTALERSGLAASIQEDELSEPHLAQSTGLVESTEANSLGRHGANQHVAVLDTGVDKAHSFLAGRVVSEACFSDGDCPGGVSSSTAVGSGVPCTFAPGDCEHGTHVAGIAAGAGRRSTASPRSRT